MLRGPQGTLFGAGSEGGTVRFIQTEPDTHRFSTYARSELSSTKNGSPSYEGGVALGGPIVADKLGFRVSAFYRREGGYIDAVDGTYSIVDPTGALYGNSVAFNRTSTIEKDVNWNRTIALRAGLKWTPNDSLTVTPSVFHQKHHLNDGAGDVFDVALSNSGNRNYARQYYKLGDPSTNPLLNPIDVPNNAYGDDEFTLSSVGVSWDLGNVELFSNTSYYDRTAVQWYDYTKGYAQYYSPEFFLAPDGSSTGTYPTMGWKSMSRYGNTQGNLVQELRLQSKDQTAKLTWVVGGFYAHNRQTAEQPISQNFLMNANWVGFYPTSWDWGYYGVNDGAPFGPGHTAAQNFFGDNMLPNGVSFLGVWKAVEEQLAGFAQADYKITDRLKFTAGLRVSSNKLDFDAAYLGPENNSNAPFGFPCPVASCTFGSGVLAPAYPVSTSHSKENAVTPKFGLSYQMDPANLFYATAAKGFRPAGASLRVPAICDADLRLNGYVDANNNPVQPTAYKSDSVWSYEIGSKNRLLGGRLVLDSSAYEIKWKNIQTNISLPTCSYNFVDNLADATSRGFDVAAQLQANDRLSLSGSVAYNDPKFDHDALSPSGAKKIFSKGAGIPGAGAPLTVTASGEYAIPLKEGRQGYLRVDWTHTSEWRRVGNLDPAAPQYDPLLKPIPSFDAVNLRFGTRIGGLDLSFFVQNLTDSAPALELSHGTWYDPQDWQNISLRPRTYGITAIWRN